MYNTDESFWFEVEGFIKRVQFGYWLPLKLDFLFYLKIRLEVSALFSLIDVLIGVLIYRLEQTTGYG